ncbi:hypothetical protein Lal_00010968 [Lupinus albus]|nr:hypothetical protein Lal_00010968 [Lupinus albus]
MVRGNNISCTLWGQFASQLLKYERDHKFGPIVVILALAKIREAKGGYPITIQNTMYGSKIFINDNNIQEIQVFTKSLGSRKPYESYNQRISNTFSSSLGGLKTIVKTISELIQLDHEFVCVTYGTIEKLFANGWYYDGCPQCNRKADAIRIPFNCPGCGKFFKEVLIKQPAVDLKELMLSEGELNPMSIPQAVDDLVTKSLAFKVKVYPTYKRCSVIQVSEDSQLIESLLDRIAPYIVTRTIEKGKAVGGMPKEDEQFECVTTAEYDPENMAYLTPKKRLASTALFDYEQDPALAQMSSIKNAKHIDNE